MKVTVWKTNLKEGLDVVEKAVAKSSTLPVLQNVFFGAKKDSIKLAATDLQLGISYTFLGKVEREGECVFAGRFLSSLLAVLGDEQLSLQLDDKQLTISAGANKSTMHTLDPEEFPIIPSIKEGDAYVEVDSEVLCKSLGQVVGMAGQSQTRPEISGVLVVFEAKETKLVATDSFRLAEKTTAFEKENSLLQTFILPQRTAREIAAIFGDKNGKIKIYPSSSQVVLDYSGEDEPAKARIQLVSRLIEGEYPRYEDVIPTEEKTRIRFQKNEFLNHVKAAGIFAGKTNEVKIRASAKENEISFLAENSDAGRHVASMKGEISGEDVEAGFNWRFLLDGLFQIQGESIDFALNGEEGPALLRASGQGGYRYVIMPIKA